MVMFDYYFGLGLRSLRRNPMLTALMVMAIGFGVAASMITYSVFRAVSGNPIPDKSARLFTPQIDAWGPQQNLKGGEPAEALGYADAMALMRANKAKHQTLLYPVQLSVIPGGNHDLPINASGYAVGATAIIVDTGTGAINAGDVVTFAGDSNKYVVKSATTTLLTLNAPGLRAAVADNAAITVGDNFTANVAFTQNALVLAARAPASPQGGDSAEDV